MELQTISFKAMGSRCELKLYATTDKLAAIAQQAIALVRSMEDKYTRYHPDSLTSRINATAGEIAPIKLDDETALLLNYAATLHQQSDGLFDITSGILRQAWNFKSGQLPDPVQLEKLVPLIGWDQVEWQAPYFRLPKPGMEIDFGGFVKEYAADRVATLCSDSGVNHGLVNLGGDIHVIGPHPDASPWHVGIQHPRIPQRAIASVAMSHGAIATSGDYERFMMVEGKRYCHLLNPHTGHSIHTPYASISVVAPQCLVAGSFSTIAMLKSQLEPSWLETSGLPYLTVDQQMRIRGSVETQDPAVNDSRDLSKFTNLH